MTCYISFGLNFNHHDNLLSDPKKVADCCNVLRKYHRQHQLVHFDSALITSRPTTKTLAFQFLQSSTTYNEFNKEIVELNSKSKGQLSQLVITIY